MENSQKNQNYWKNFKKSTKLYLLLPFLDKINPYRETRINEDTGIILDSRSSVMYRAFVQWAVDVHLNGAILCFILAVFGKQQLHYFYVLANGLSIWIVFKLSAIFGDGLTSRLIKIVRNLPKK